MGDKNPKNIAKLKEQAEEKKEELVEWKHETPAEKQVILEREESDENSEPEEEA